MRLILSVLRPLTTVAHLPAASYYLIIMYVLAIFIFAQIYYKLPGEFYHGTTKYEPSLKDDAAQIRDHLRQEIVAEFLKKNGTVLIQSEGWKGDISKTEMAYFKVDDATISFRLRLTLLRNDEMQARTSLTASWPVEERLIVGLPPNETYLVPLSFSENKVFPNKAKVVYPYDGDGVGTVPTDTVMFPLSRPLYGDITGFWNAYNKGQPAHVSGYYARILYLSAMTITTVGYGDIVPITPRARLYVALEAILGIILIGLFVNSLFQHRRSDKRGNAKLLEELLDTPLP